MAEPTDRIAVISPAGIPGTIELSQLGDALEQGFRLEHPDATEERRKVAKEEARGIGGGIQTLAEGVADVATWGTVDWLVKDEKQREDMERRKRVFPGYRLTGEVIGMVGPGAGKVYGKAAEKAGESVLKAAASKRLGQTVIGGTEKGLKSAAGGLGRVGAAAVRGGVDVAGYEAGMGMAELGLSDDPVTPERMVGVLGSRALHGFAFGAPLGALGGLMGETARYAKAKLRTESMAAAGEIPEDIALMDRYQLGEANKLEDARVIGERKAAGREIFDQATEYKDWLRGKFFYTKDAESALRLGKTRKRLMRTIEDPLSIAEDPRPLQKTLREQSTLLERNVIPELEAEVLNPTPRIAEPKVKARRPPGWSNPTRLPISGGVPDFANIEARRLYRMPAEELRTRGIWENLSSNVVKPEESFADQVIGAARGVPAESRLGEKVFIRDVYDSFLARNPGSEMSLSEFKNGLRSEREAGRLNLDRSDFLERTEMEGTRNASQMEIFPGKEGGPVAHLVDLRGVPEVAAPKAVRMGMSLDPLIAITKAGKGAKTPPLVMGIAADGRLVLDDGRRRLSAALAQDGDVLVKFRRAADSEFAGPVFEGPPRSSVNAERRLAEAKEALDVNLALQRRIEAIRGPIDTPRKQAIAARLDELRAGGAPAKHGFARQAARAAAGSVAMGAAMNAGAPFTVALMAGMGVSALAGRALGMKSGQKLVGTMGAKMAARKAAAEAAIDRLLSSKVPGKVDSLGRKSAVAVTTTAEREKVDQRRADMIATIRASAAFGADGRATISPKARSGIHENLAGIRAIDPKLADAIETAAADRVAFLISKLPGGPQSDLFGPPTHHYSDFEMRRVERYVRAADDPDAIIERAANGEMTVEDAETLKAVFPKTLEWARMRTLERMQYVTSLPYQKRLVLSMMFDVPLHNSIRPASISTLQETYAADEAAKQEQSVQGKPLPKPPKPPLPTPAQVFSTGR